MNATALDRATPVGLLLHVYWNLGGEGSGDVLGHTLRIRASRHAVLDDELLPSSGRVEPVAGTPMDFRAPTAIGSRIRRVVVMGGRAVGYDTNYVVDAEGMRPVAQARDPASGRALELWANQPTLQLYTGNSLNRTAARAAGCTTGLMIMHVRVYQLYLGENLQDLFWGLGFQDRQSLLLHQN
ncbi:Aldose 1-epimerase [Zea mays]|uniref:Aldose 1-epimerase n=1 Tax=Zea mays TaxID=4577 RepID=A0A3L6G638_MAIZE|nr:Aldose 1-epimerase [Zea mays]